MSDEQARLDFDAPRQGRAVVLRHHHVRSHQPVHEAVEGERHATTQEHAVLEWLRLQDACLPGLRFTPSRVWGLFLGHRGPLQSIRRALTNLADEKIHGPRPPLCHHPADRHPGLYGPRSWESTWGLRSSCPTHRYIEEV